MKDLDLRLSTNMDTLDRLHKLGLVKETEYKFAKKILER